MTTSKPGLVLALGGGGARGLAHIGVLEVLVENDLPVRAVVGTSIGAEIGAFLASGMSMPELRSLATAVDWKRTLHLFMPDLPGGGLASGRNIVEFLDDALGHQDIDELTLDYAAVATELESGRQVVLDSGSLTQAVRASISMPGVLAPVKVDDRALIDGGVVNPVPFDVARERFGGPVVAVAVHLGAARTPGTAMRRTRASQWREGAAALLKQEWIAEAEPLRRWLQSQLSNGDDKKPPEWSTRMVLDRVFDITQSEIVRLRAELSPPDLMLAPDVQDIGTLEFYRADEVVAAGRAAATAQLDDLRRLLDVSSHAQKAERVE